MRLAYRIVDTLMWLTHGAALFTLLWIIGSHQSAGATVLLIGLLIAADLVIALPLRRLAQNIQSHTVI